MKAKAFVTVAALIIGLWCEGLIEVCGFVVREAHDDIVVVEDCAGELYLLDENDGWMVGDFAVALKSTNGTEDPKDDEILLMKPFGFDVCFKEAD